MAAIDEFAMSAAYLLNRRHTEQLTDGRLEAANRAVALLESAGILDDPASLYQPTRAPVDVRTTRRERGGIAFEHLSFDSVHPSPTGLAALTAWDVAGNERVHAYLLRHGDRPRPWALSTTGTSVILRESPGIRELS